ncbi:hypothetical protein ADUPG1_011587 [Aduncisulcus paluster]|uniref:Uncharacterized protein n=1 Tax=Aduncisulcus paluster TaxID=2918883 RepID=A0ABQ5JW98_9EUKA|nr:hypothetical protein ADUPG1_011587 [Aduncisulcus paluster]
MSHLYSFFPKEYQFIAEDSIDVRHLSDSPVFSANIPSISHLYLPESDGCQFISFDIKGASFFTLSLLGLTLGFTSWDELASKYIPVPLFQHSKHLRQVILTKTFGPAVNMSVAVMSEILAVCVCLAVNMTQFCLIQAQEKDKSEFIPFLETSPSLRSFSLTEAFQKPDVSTFPSHMNHIISYIAQYSKTIRSAAMNLSTDMSTVRSSKDEVLAQEKDKSEFIPFLETSPSLRSFSLTEAFQKPDVSTFTSWFELAGHKQGNSSKRWKPPTNHPFNLLNHIPTLSSSSSSSFVPVHKLERADGLVTLVLLYWYSIFVPFIMPVNVSIVRVEERSFYFVRKTRKWPRLKFEKKEEERKAKEEASEGEKESVEKDSQPGEIDKTPSVFKELSLLFEFSRLSIDSLFCLKDPITEIKELTHSSFCPAVCRERSIKIDLEKDCVNKKGEIVELETLCGSKRRRRRFTKTRQLVQSHGKPKDEKRKDSNGNSKEGKQGKKDEQYLGKRRTSPKDHPDKPSEGK